MAIVVKRRPQDTDDRLISNFRKAIIDSKFIDLIKERMFYLKPSAKRNLNRKRRRRTRR